MARLNSDGPVAQADPIESDGGGGRKVMKRYPDT